MSRSLFSLFRVRFTFYERAICSFHRKLNVGLNNRYQNCWLCFHKKEWFTLHHSSRSLQKERRSDALFCQKTSNSHTKNNERIPNHGQNPKLGILLSPDPGDFSKTLPANRNGKSRTNFTKDLHYYCHVGTVGTCTAQYGMFFNRNLWQFCKRHIFLSRLFSGNKYKKKTLSPAAL